MQVLNTPPQDIVLRSKHKEKFFDSQLQPKIIENKKGVKKMPGTRPLTEVLRGSPAGFIDFVQKCLTWEPENRLKPIEGLDHPWIAEGLKRKNKAV